MRTSPGLAAAWLLAVVSTTPALAQQPGAGCRFLPGSGDATQRTYPDGIIVSAKRATIRCNDGRSIRADSMSYYQASGYAEFFGNVRFEDADRTLVADTATYTEANRRLSADGSVEVTDRRDNSRITDGESLIYFRAGGGRVTDEMTVFGGRPHAILQPAAGDSIDGPDAPWDVIGDRIRLVGESWFEAQGDVQLLRDSIEARSDSLTYSEDTGTLNLVGRARMEQGQTILTGRRIRARIPQNEIEELVAFGEGELRAEDLELDAPWIRVTFRAGDLQALYAAPLTRQAEDPVTEEGQEPEPDAPPARPTERELIAQEMRGQDAGLNPMQALRDSLDALQPVAVAEGTTIRADSLDVRAPAQEIEKVVAVGRAHAISASRDSINTARTPDFAREDWIRGDTIVATFVRGEPELVAARTPEESTAMPVDLSQQPAAPQTRSGKLEIEQLVATGSASSMYRIPPDSTAADSTAAPLDATGADAPADTATGSGNVPPPPVVVPVVTPENSAELIAAADSLVFTPLPGKEPAIHYVAARQITLNFVAGEIDTMIVLDLEEGIHLEPGRPGSDDEARGSIPATSAGVGGGIR